MKKNQYMKLGLASLAIMSSMVFTQAQAQTEQKAKGAPAKSSKIKILKEENGEFLLLDTTLTITDGMAIEEAVKKLQEGGVTLKSLGAKAIKPAKIGSAKEIKGLKVFSLRPGDSLRKNIDIVRFRTSHSGDSLRAVTFTSVMPDSVFSRLREARVYRIEGSARETLRVIEARPTEVSGNKIFFRSQVKVDSLLGSHTIYRIDTSRSLRADTIFLRETIRVERDGDEVKMFRIKKDGARPLLETGEYDVIKLRGDGQSKVLILRPSKEQAKAGQKGATKALKESKKKEPLVPTQKDIQLYPNPTSGKVNLSFAVQKRANAQVRVVDSKGKTVYQEDLGSVQGNYSKDLDLSTYGKGMYVVQVLIGSTAQSGKVVVQ